MHLLIHATHACMQGRIGSRRRQAGTATAAEQQPGGDVNFPTLASITSADAAAASPALHPRQQGGRGTHARRLCLLLSQRRVPGQPLLVCCCLRQEGVVQQLGPVQPQRGLLLKQSLLEDSTPISAGQCQGQRQDSTRSPTQPNRLPAASRRSHAPAYAPQQHLLPARPPTPLARPPAGML